jgi:hypothetical protein
MNNQPNATGDSVSDATALLASLTPQQRQRVLNGMKTGRYRGAPQVIQVTDVPDSEQDAEQDVAGQRSELELENEVSAVDLHRWFKHVKVVSLEKFPDRWEDFKMRADEAGVTGYDLYPAVLGDKVNPSGWFRGGNGAWGCLMSHLRIAQDALMGEEGHLMVMEDDCVFADNFAERMHAIMDEVGDDWDMLYLGGQHLHHPRLKPYRTPQYAEVIHARNINRTHAFAVNKRFLQKYQQHILYAPDYIEADGAWHIDHMLGSLHEHQREYRILCAQPWICGQAAGKSWTCGKDVGEMWWIMPEDNIAKRGA